MTGADSPLSAAARLAAGAAKTLRDEGFSGEICVVAEEQWDFYERPPLSKAALLEAEPALPRLFSAEVQQALDLRWYRPLRAKSIDRQNKTLALSNGETLAYDLLLIATGGRARLPSEAWGQHPQVYTLRHWQDAQRLKQRLASATRLAIVGGGWIGLEIAASARKSGVAVTLYEQQPALCMRSVSMEVSQALDELHRGQGVDIRRGCGALELEDDNGLPTLHCDGQRETFDAVVVGIGVDLNLELARDAGLTVDRGIVVNAQGRSNDPAIFAAGDVASTISTVCAFSRGPLAKSGHRDSESDARSTGQRLRRGAVAVVRSIRSQCPDPRDPASGQPDHCA
ncbi:pyridine nucleotide-disulfide oxidoreductase [Klebsiella pneumoniae]|uniref:Pyridine nucleotide-disulfide oxidoreductase n=1 Tax=Klebsiella pneumoniae TaxID=573 RepID=A0A378BR32_KLEPN|nr:pyridine nucleotide-disulfide oxidoreductase [Klebsiella pneumoniae]